MKKQYFLLIFLLITIMNLFAQPLDELLTDINGNTYKTIKIGDQIWMAEFLKTTKYQDGSDIPKVNDNKKWSDLTSGAYCDFYNKPENLKKYGRLYNKFAVNDKRNICPKGWHVPSHQEWITMDSALRSSTKYNNYKGWWSYEVHGSSYLPPDFRDKEGSFLNEDVLLQTHYGGWWTSTYFNNDETWYVTVGFSSYLMMFNKYMNTGGFCILCVKD